MEMPLVSIIVPVYNAQSHLSRCLESICGQEYKNLELIVINDGSKDKSLPVCEEFRKKDSRILLVDKANSGVSDTRNLGLKLAGGKYVQFVDSDDYIAPDYTARLVEAAEKTGADLVISPYTMVIPAGASKPEQVLEKIQDDLGVMHVARPPENREYGFLPEGVYDKDTFARRLMDKPASTFTACSGTSSTAATSSPGTTSALPARCAGPKTSCSTCSISSTPKSLRPSRSPATTMSRTLRASATPR